MFPFNLPRSTDFIRFFSRHIFSCSVSLSTKHKKKQDSRLKIHTSGWKFNLVSWTRKLSEKASSKEVKFINYSQTKLAIGNSIVLHGSHLTTRPWLAVETPQLDTLSPLCSCWRVSCCSSFSGKVVLAGEEQVMKCKLGDIHHGILTENEGQGIILSLIL